MFSFDCKERFYLTDFGKIHVLTDPSGTIQSPNYPGRYGGLARDTYIIRATPSNSKIKLVIDAMDVSISYI